MSFYADFNIDGNGAFANENINIKNGSNIGAILDSDNLSIDGNVSKDDLNLNDYTVSNITKLEWILSDGYHYYTDLVVHKFEEPGQKQIKLTIWSDQFVFGNEKFYFKYTITKEVTIQSRFYKFLMDNFPIWDNIKNEYYDTLLQSLGAFWDNIHAKISSVYDLSNIKKIDPNYFDLLAETLGHKDYYHKVGYSSEYNIDFNDYDIITRIHDGVATDKELYAFKLFLQTSSDLFKKKGTPNDLNKFLSLFSINSEIKDLWTKTFGKEKVGSLKESFCNFSFNDNILGLSWGNIKIASIDNSHGHVSNKEGSLLLNTYYKVQKYEHPTDLFNQVPIVNNIHPTWQQYELPRYVKEIQFIGDDYFTPIEYWKTPDEITDLLVQLNAVDNVENKRRIVFDDTITKVEYIDETKCIRVVNDEVGNIKGFPTFMLHDINYDNGISISNFIQNNDINTYIADWRTVLPSGNLLVINVSAMPPSGYFQYYPYLQSHNLLEIDNLINNGDRISSEYLIANENIVQSAIVGKNTISKNSTGTLKFQFSKPHPLTYRVKDTDDSLFYIFRAEIGVDKNIESFYRVRLNLKKATISISKIVKTEDSFVNQKINLGSSENVIYEKDISTLIDVSNRNNIYELYVNVNESLVNVRLKNLIIETSIRHNIINGLGDSNYTTPYEEESWVNIIENLNINIQQSNVISYNSKDEVLINVPYTYTDDKGLNGFGVSNSITEVFEFCVDILDNKEDYYNDIEKQLYIKPKYLDWQQEKYVKLNTYGKNDYPIFNDIIIDNYNTNNITVEQSSEKINSIEKIYFNNINVTDELSSRYTVWFDKEWLKKNYTSNGEFNNSFFSKIVIPIGKQKSIFLTENNVYDAELYRDYLGNNTSGIGNFIANNTPILDSYLTIPDDSLSYLEKMENNTYKISNKLQQYSVGNPLNVQYVYEEILPKSNYIEELDGEYVLPDNTIFKNKLYNFIYFKNDCDIRVLGIKFKNCKDIEKLIKNYSTDLNKDIELLGSFTFHVPKYSVYNAPNNDFEQSELYNDFIKYTTTLNLGILNKDIKNYSISKQYLLSSGRIIIQLNGIYVKLNTDQFSYSDNVISIKNINQYENNYNKLFCKYWIGSNVKLSTSIYKDTEVNLSTDDSGINFFINENFRKIISNITLNSDDYNWWLPSKNNEWSGVYRERDFEIETVDIINDIVTNINYFGYDESPVVDCETQQERASSKLFVGNIVGGYTDDISGSKCVNAVNTPNALTFRILGGEVTPNTIYYAKMTIKVNYSGFDQDDIDILDDTIKSFLKINKKDKVKLTKSPVVRCYTAYIPVSWYDNNHIIDNTIQYGNYIKGSYGSAGSPAITLIPYGLATEILNKLETINKSIKDNNDFTIWNEYIIKNISIDNIYEPIPSNVCVLYKNFGLFNTLNLNNGSYVNIKYNTSSYDWNVIKEYKYYFDDNKENFFELPAEINTIESWNTNVKGITLNNYILESKYYTINENNIVFESLPKILNNSNMYGSYIISEYNENNNLNNIKTTTNFNTENNIKFLPYETSGLNPFTLLNRKSSEDLAFNSTDYIYDVIPVDGVYSMKVNFNNTDIVSTYGKSGSENILKSINVNLSSLPDIEKLFVLSENSSIYGISCDVYFDSILDKLGNCKGKRLEYIIKASYSSDIKTNKNILKEYYFVGIGTYDFDIALGIAKYNPETGLMDKSILAGFGDYNTKNILSKTWYNLNVRISNEYIKVYFNETKSKPRLVMNYNTTVYNRDYTGINSGKYEEITYLVKQLSNIDISYLNEIGSKVDSAFIKQNINLDIVNVKPNGSVTGFVVFNEYTYITNITYITNPPIQRKLNNVNDNTELTTILNEIEITYGGYEKCNFIGKLLTGIILVHVDDILYYKIPNGNLVKYMVDVKHVSVFKNYIIVTLYINNNTDIIVIDENLKDKYSIFVKDHTFHVDQIYRYLQFTGKNVKDVFVNSNELTIVTI